MSDSLQYNQQEEPEQCKSEVEEMYLPKSGNWPSIPENTDAMLENASEETVSESSQIKE